MRISQVCIDRPVLATVMSLVILLFGLLSVTRLANRYLPNVDPPVVSITTVFPGAAPEVVETSVTDPLEDQVNGIEGVKQLTSISREQVSMISVEFELGRDLEAAANDVRDRVSRARNHLPEEVEAPVVAKQDSDASAVIWMALYGEGFDQIQLTSIAETQIVDRLTKLPGVASVIIAGERRYSMRVWIDNRRLAAQSLTIADVADALGRENVDIPSGRLESSSTEFTVRSLGELQAPEEFGDLIIQNVDGKPVRIRDVARVEVGPESARKLLRFNGEPGVGLGVVKQSTANTIDVADGVQAEVDALRPELPPGVQLVVAWDSSRYIRQSIADVTRTIFEAAVLVILVIYVFLRSFRATLIPAVTIPVSILGAFAALYFLGFTINTLTLMGVTLAIGLVVDDAIVVLENISRWVESGTPRLEAARRGMQEISFAVVAATLSAVAVFLPLTFLTDTTGRLFREFAVTVAAALLISGFVAITLSPALCALILRTGRTDTGLKAAFGRFFEWLAAAYAASLARVLRRPGLFVGLGAAWLVLGVALLPFIDEELIPKSDRSVFFVWTQAPEGSTIEYMDRYQFQAEQVVMAEPEVRRTFSVIALGLGTPGLVNQGLVIGGLDDPDERDRSGDEIADAVSPRLERIAGIKAHASTPSAFSGFLASPVSFVIEGSDLQALASYADEIERRLGEVDGIRHVNSDLYLNKPQMEVEIDRNRASDLGISVREIASALQILLGGLDLSTFKLGGETYDVMVQLGREERNDPRDLLELYVRGNNEALIGLSAVVRMRETIAPREIPHFNRRRSVAISADLEDRLPQGEAIEVARAIAAEVLPEQGYAIRFTGEAEKFLESGSALVFAYGLAILVVFLVLAAQFESFMHPITILVAVAFSFTGALIALLAVARLNDWGLVGLPGTLNLFSKIGLVMLVGLVTKNSILIVEFANQLRARGLGVAEAVEQAARTRFRPILMTALATMAGILPIALGRGAGGDARAPMGIAVVGGMFFSTLLSFFIVPATYVVIDRLRAGILRRFRVAPTEAPSPAAAGGS
ncbi:MAG: efflux RND transporter permease subunit [Myxococcales bacterium]|nr:efflux RND transporter permease subunit [Myxococcales bacterium]